LLPALAAEMKSAMVDCMTMRSTMTNYAGDVLSLYKMK